MKCPNCGSETQGKFCTTCGSRMPDEEMPAAGAPDPNATARFSTSDLAQMSNQEPSQPSTPPPTPTPPPAAPPPTGGWPSTPQKPPPTPYAQPGQDPTEPRPAGQMNWATGGPAS